MKRTERTEFNEIKRTLKHYQEEGILTYGSLLSIRTDRSSEYKNALHEHYTGLGYHPAAVRTDTKGFDGTERIIYIYGLTWDCNGEERSWTELYTKEEKNLFQAKLA